MELFVSLISDKPVESWGKNKTFHLGLLRPQKRIDEGRPVPIVLGNLGAAFAVGSNFLWF